MFKLGKRTLRSLLSATAALTICCSMSAFALTGVVNTEAGLRLRESASVASASMAVIDNGSKVQILSAENGWCHVSVNGLDGYMSEKYLVITDDLPTEQVPSAETPAPASLEVKGIINASAVNLRESASTASRVVDILHFGQSVSVTSADGQWYKVTTPKGSGYVFAEYLDVKAEQSVAVSNSTELYICGNGVNFREGASTESTVITVLPYGTKVTHCETLGEWTIVSHNGRTGYVYSTYLTSEQPGAAGIILAKAAQYLGTPYVYGGTTPSGFDCSGFTQYVFADSGIALSRTAHSQISDGYSITRDQLIPGDLVFFSEGNTGYATHVGIYAGNGMFIHSSSRGIVYNYLTDYYYRDYYMCACRVL